MKDGKYVFPQMNNAVLTRALRMAINRDRLLIVRFLLSLRVLENSYLHPGVEVTEDMLTIAGQGPRIKELLIKHLEQQLINVQNHDM